MLIERTVLVKKSVSSLYTVHILSLIMNQVYKIIMNISFIHHSNDTPSIQNIFERLDIILKCNDL